MYKNVLAVLGLFVFAVLVVDGQASGDRKYHQHTVGSRTEYHYHPTKDNMCGAHNYGECTGDQWATGWFKFWCDHLGINPPGTTTCAGSRNAYRFNRPPTAGASPQTGGGGDPIIGYFSPTVPVRRSSEGIRYVGTVDAFDRCFHALAEMIARGEDLNPHQHDHHTHNNYGDSDSRNVGIPRNRRPQVCRDAGLG